MDDVKPKKGYYSILRWRSDIARDEAKNVAIILVDPEGEYGGFRAAPLGTISPRLRDQGLLDDILNGIRVQFEAPEKPDIGFLNDLHESLTHSIVITEPKPVVIPDEKKTLNALYRAYVSRSQGRSKVLSRSKVLDLVVVKLRGRGYEVKRTSYVDEFLFDAVIERGTGKRPVCGEVLSFATRAADWSASEYNAGHFLYAITRLEVPGFAVIQPPTPASHMNASISFDRVSSWFHHEDVPILDPDTLDNGSLPL